eukprot:TRINITY_DN1568_c1_g3_i1.p1 TRINITY_DN1568_c1_g3~~TRINITY_DN1568_c1_g3_i1.p1  ORF type:complete len:269 (-),score=15.37 TRINITY_DN1568_c1_g3_i1:142-948(-)
MNYIENLRASIWSYVGLIAVYSLMFLFLLFRRAYNLNKHSFYGRGLLSFGILLIFVRIAAFFDVVYGKYIVWNGDKDSLGSPLTLANLYLLAFGEASISSCYLSLNYIWLKVLNRKYAQKRTYAISTIFIWLIIILSLVPFSLNRENTTFYIFPFSASVALLFTFSAMGIIISFKAINNFSSWNDGVLKSKFQIKGYLTLLVGVLLVIKTAIYIYLVLWVVQNENNTAFYIPVTYFLLELIPIFILNNIFRPSRNAMSISLSNLSLYS